MYKAMWEKKYSKSAADATENQLLQFVYKCVPPSSSPSILTTRREQPKSASTKKSRVASGSKGKAAAKSEVQEATPNKALIKPQPEVGTPQGATGGISIYTTGADLFLWGEAAAEFEFQGNCDASIIQKGEWECAYHGLSSITPDIPLT
jgi:hypothetical protein